MRRAALCLQDILTGQAKLVGNQRVRYGLPGRVDVGGEVTARDIIIATGSVPFVPPGGFLGVPTGPHAALRSFASAAASQRVEAQEGTAVPQGRTMSTGSRGCTHRSHNGAGLWAVPLRRHPY